MLTLDMSGLSGAPVQCPTGAGCSLPSVSSYKILLVEDSLVQQRVMTLKLKNLGHQVTTASDGSEAIAAVKSAKFDAILMDCQMMPVDGMTATRSIRLLPEAQDGLLIIGISATATAEECIEAGMNDFLAKPLNNNILQQALERWITKHASNVIKPLAYETSDAGLQV